MQSRLVTYATTRPPDSEQLERIGEKSGIASLLTEFEVCAEGYLLAISI